MCVRDNGSLHWTDRIDEEVAGRTIQTGVRVRDRRIHQTYDLLSSIAEGTTATKTVDLDRNCTDREAPWRSLCSPSIVLRNARDLWCPTLQGRENGGFATARAAAGVHDDLDVRFSMKECGIIEFRDRYASQSGQDPGLNEKLHAGIKEGSMRNVCRQRNESVARIAVGRHRGFA